MPVELVYSSVEEGLFPGSRGFCVVAMTRGIPQELRQRMEALSGYRHLYDPGDPRNPVVYHFVRVKVQSGEYYIISRVKDAGRDYTGRSNKLAHHVALARTELPICGPAEILVAWDRLFPLQLQQPAYLEPRAVSWPISGPTSAATWQALTGDAQWARAVGVRLARQGDGKAEWFIVPPHVDALLLIRELCAQLPDAVRWQISFSTFPQLLPSHVDCAIRCVTDGTPEAERLRDDKTQRVLDFGRPWNNPPRETQLAGPVVLPHASETVLPWPVSGQHERPLAHWGNGMLTPPPSHTTGRAAVDDFTNRQFDSVTGAQKGLRPMSAAQAVPAAPPLGVTPPALPAGRYTAGDVDPSPAPDLFVTAERTKRARLENSPVLREPLTSLYSTLYALSIVLLILVMGITLFMTWPRLATVVSNRIKSSRPEKADATEPVPRQVADHKSDAEKESTEDTNSEPKSNHGDDAHGAKSHPETASGSEPMSTTVNEQPPRRTPNSQAVQESGPDTNREATAPKPAVDSGSSTGSSKPKDNTQDDPNMPTSGNTNPSMLEWHPEPLPNDTPNQLFDWQIILQEVNNKPFEKFIQHKFAIDRGKPFYVFFCPCCVTCEPSADLKTPTSPHPAVPNGDDGNGEMATIQHALKHAECPNDKTSPLLFFGRYFKDKSSSKIIVLGVVLGKNLREENTDTVVSLRHVLPHSMENAPVPPHVVIGYIANIASALQTFAEIDVKEKLFVKADGSYQVEPASEGKLIIRKDGRVWELLIAEPDPQSHSPRKAILLKPGRNPADGIPFEIAVCCLVEIKWNQYRQKGDEPTENKLWFFLPIQRPK